jgi:hypothetical protein
MQLHRTLRGVGFRAATALALAASSGALAGSESSNRLPQPQAGAEAAWQRVDRLIGAAACRRDGECATLPLPDQACGGPRGWIAFAPSQTDPAALARALAALPADPPGTMSTCLWRPDPGAVCRGASDSRNGRCVLREAAPGSPSPR